MSGPTSQLLLQYERLKGFFNQRVGCRHEAADLTQETYARALNTGAAGDVRHPSGLLFCIARNLLADRGRRRARHPEFESLSEGGERVAEQAWSPARSTEARDRLARVQAAIDGLSERCREVFVLNRFEGLSYPEIGKRLGLSVSTVEKHMIRALKACRAVLD